MIYLDLENGSVYRDLVNEHTIVTLSDHGVLRAISLATGSRIAFDQAAVASYEPVLPDSDNLTALKDATKEIEFLGNWIMPDDYTVYDLFALNCTPSLTESRVSIDTPALNGVFVGMADGIEIGRTTGKHLSLANPRREYALTRAAMWRWIMRHGTADLRSRFLAKRSEGRYLL